MLQPDELVIDNFAGGGGASTGIEAAIGRAIDIAINHDAEAIAMHLANHPRTLHLTEDVWKVDIRRVVAGRKVGIAWFSPDCFPAGTLVLTDRGYRPIDDIEVGDMVLTHRQRWRRVTETASTFKQLVEVRGYGHPGIRVSREHPFYVRRRKNVWDNSIRQYRAKYTESEWAPASLLEKGWYWSTPTEVSPLVIPDMDRSSKKGTSVPVDERLLWLAGRYVGDGWTRLTDTRAELVIICGKHESESLAQKLDLWPRSALRVKDGELAWHSREVETACQFATNCRALVMWLREHFGHGAEFKGVPGWIFGADERLRRAFLDGYLSADGHRTPLQNGNTLTEATTVSKRLAFGLKTLASTLGYTASVYRNDSPTNVIEGRKVNSKTAYSVRWRREVSDSHTQTFSEGGLRWSPVRERITKFESEVVYNIGVEEDESYVAEGVIVHNCKHFSKAKGGRPVEKKIRGLAWVALRWAGIARPRVICLENVEEFVTWAPVHRKPVAGQRRKRCRHCGELIDGRPCPARKGQTFQRWVSQLRGLGYAVEWRELRACDYGAPTIRKRLVIVARCDGQPIQWPARTHGPGLKPYRTAAECIDWSIPCPSIFLTSDEARKVGCKRPLAEATMRRIARGVKRYVLDAAQPFIVPVTHQGSDRIESIDEPMRTITGAHRGEKALVTAFLTSYYGDKRPYDVRGCSIEEPIPTQPTENRHALVAAFLSRQFGASVGSAADSPAGTTTAGGGGKSALIASHLVKLRGTCRDGQPVTEPLATVSAQGTHLAEVRAFLLKYYGAEQDPRLDDPLHTVTSKARFGLVTVHGQDYAIVDIGMRMLTPRELFRAQGFPESYIIDGGRRSRAPLFSAAGERLSKAAQIRMVGNSVCPPLAEAIVRAQFGLCECEEIAA